MKKIIKILAIFSIAILLFSSCKTREKQVQKSENQSEYKSEASAKIETKTFEIVQDKELSIFDKSNFAKNSETQKEQTKDIQVIREYYENGNLKSEIQKSFSQLSEATKYAIAEMREKLSKEKETSQYWEDSSNHFYKAFEQEKTKTKDYAMKLKAKETFTWQMFFVGVILGVFLLPLLRWLFSWLIRLQPHIALVEFLKRKIC
jgi:FtsZ-interacting cell division protein ZipA